VPEAAVAEQNHLLVALVEPVAVALQVGHPLVMAEPELLTLGVVVRVQTVVVGIREHMLAATAALALSSLKCLTM
jgi:hypothetical protein